MGKKTTVLIEMQSRNTKDHQNGCNSSLTKDQVSGISIKRGFVSEITSGSDSTQILVTRQRRRVWKK